ncbi:hypothetical protein [Endozoicomonas sp.]|uniref:hypothetical protein n=1 Tax=Endozoicomonas sp. TaxID=1892382 RepID=UPI003AF837BF
MNVKLSNINAGGDFSELAPALKVVNSGARECCLYPEVVRHFTQDGASRRSGSHFDGKHFVLSRRSIEKAASIPSQKNHAVIMGAGNLTDIPIETLAKTYKKVTLVDIDTSSPRVAISNRLSSEYKSKLAYMQADLTGVMNQLCLLIRHVVDGLPSPETNTEKEELLALFETRLDEVYRKGLSFQGEYPNVRGDFVSVSLVLSQLSVLIRDYAQSCFNEKYDFPEIPDSTRKTAAYDALSDKMQADFLDAVVKTVEPEGVVYFGISKSLNIDICDNFGQWQQSAQVELVKDETMIDWLSQFEVKDESSWQWCDLDGEGVRRSFDIDSYTILFPK